MTDPGIILFGQKIGLVESSQSISDDNNPKTPSIGEDVNIMVENSQSKKPDKVLACPRCDSMNTKFCYFNNSNVNQPRHFCKSCQRYWTAGGTMRNMPVGAGRRKKKSPYIISQDVNNHIEFDQNVLSFSRKENHVKVDVDASNGNGFESFNSQVQWIPGPYNNPWNVNTPMIPLPITIPMYPPPYWSSVSWLPPAGGSVLGKHTINGWSNEEFKKQKSTILTPKTLRIDDPDEAAKSSIWTTLGIKNEDCGRGDLFKGLQSKGSEKAKMLHTNTEPNLAMQANPAAFSRSLCFQERA